MDIKKKKKKKNMIIKQNKTCNLYLLLEAHMKHGVKFIYDESTDRFKRNTCDKSSNIGD